ncbi:hypothetical protein B0H13DRAFT_1874559 [Mycena leptocephala]|nr:hypothetical protein B0H13DRAFT_1874559 [Mycena leptocephala]
MDPAFQRLWGTSGSASARVQVPPTRIYEFEGSSSPIGKVASSKSAVGQGSIGGNEEFGLEWGLEEFQLGANIQNTTSNECSDQISAESDGLIGSYGIADRDPKRGDINFLSIGPPPHLPSPFLHHFFLDPRLWGLVRIPRCWPSI